MIYYHKYLYMFRALICPSSGVKVVCYCIWCSALGVVAVVLRSQCVVLYTVCKFVSDWQCPKHVEIFMIVNHNCCIKLVPLAIFKFLQLEKAWEYNVDIKHISINFQSACDSIQTDKVHDIMKFFVVPNILTRLIKEMYDLA
jgi:hypothetical protein